MAQLNAITGSSSALTGRVDALDLRVDDLDTRVDQVGAMSAAYGSLAPNPYATGNNQLSMAVGTYRGKQTLAAGYYRKVGNSVLLNATVSSSGDDTAGGIGASFGW